MTKLVRSVPLSLVVGVFLYLTSSSSVDSSSGVMMYSKTESEYLDLTAAMLLERCWTF